MMADTVTVTVTGLIMTEHFHQAAVAGSSPAVRLVSPADHHHHHHHPLLSSPPHLVFRFNKQPELVIFIELLSLEKMFQIWRKMF